MTITAMPPTASTAGADGQQAAAPKSRNKLVIIAVTVLALAGAAYWFVLREAPVDTGPPEPGSVVALEPIQVNLAGGHYLKIGVALQLTVDAHEVDGSKALDAVIDLFSGRSMSDLASAEKRRALKEELTVQLDELYHGEVIEPYFTDFVTQ